MVSMLALIEFMREIDATVATRFKDHPYVPAYTIAGGALRDTLLGQPVKDIDIVVASQERWLDTAWPGAEYGPTGGFSAADAEFTVRGLPVQLIYRDGDISTESMMRYHSMAVSNVFWRNGAITIDQQWFKDVRDKQHTVNRARWGGVGDDVNEHRLQKYIDKITAKYPWPLREQVTRHG